MKKENELIDITEVMKNNRMLIINLMLEKGIKVLELESPIFCSLNKVLTQFNSISISMNKERICYHYNNLYGDGLLVDFEIDMQTEYRILTEVHALLSPKPWEKVKKRNK